MNLLAFDTASEWCTAALWQDGAVAFRAIHAGQTHSDLLLPMLMELLAEAGFSLKQMDGLAYGMGPGSFTGLRIACGVAQGLALGADLPVLGISTLEALAEEARQTLGAQAVLACLDARMNEVYAGRYLWSGGNWQCQGGPLVCPPDALPTVEGAWFGAGSGFAAYPGLARGLTGARADLLPHARAIAALAAARFVRGEGLPAEGAEPLYIRDKVARKISER
ncbi:MAG: tRNA (adenosine(37)-N6)-threonylcarbamoyltransferase complex dimerization subunit type 1 TsaB [Pseudomonadota bacterium]